MGFDHNRDGAIDMDIDATAHEMGVLRTTGDVFDREWKAVKDRITTLSARLGKGPMGAEFTKSYEPWAQSLKQYADDVVAGYRQLADAGDGCVAKYREADIAASRLYKT